VNSVLPLRVVDLASPAAAVPPPVAELRRTFEPSHVARPFAGPSPAAPAARGAPTLPAALRDIEGVRARIDDMLLQARRGRAFSPQELLCLQADSHRYAQTVEFAARAVEHGVQGLRQALNAQV
jgi:hypothetical protein